MFEHKREPLIPRSQFFQRALAYFLIPASVLGFSLLIGVLGYRHFCGLGWADALLNASMILTGMGPVNEMRTLGAKLFASCYALYSGVAFLSTVAILFAPAAHRFMHILHLEGEGD